jgi:mannose-1-phosphate guanylyltransferase/mannose-6-phosphate isomerase
MKILPIILSGGFGTRLWPLSRQQMPKQFLDNLFDNETLFAKTLKITSNKDIFLSPIAITHQDHKFLALQQFVNLEIDPTNILLEPQAKNTAVAIICATLQAIRLNKNENLKILILPCDHLIFPQDKFEQSILNALEMADNNIITFGVNPTFPATGYGYIKKANTVSKSCFEIEKFVEKPNLTNAQKFIEANQYLWNAGIFLFQANVLISQAAKFLPKQLEIAELAIQNSLDEDIFTLLPDEIYSKAEDISIDYGILEKTHNIIVTEMLANWSDVGDFNSIHIVKQKDTNNNVTEGNVALFNTKNSLIRSEKSLVTCLGLDNIIAIETDDALLIANKNESQNIKEITKDFISQNKNEVKFHNRVYRPWGYYETIQSCQNYKVKRLLVNSHCSLSLQLHNYRSEHWVVIKGTASVEKGNQTFDLPKGESTFIETQQKHRLSNNQNEVLEIIEVQIGSKVDEDDIERFADNYGRK